MIRRPWHMSVRSARRLFLVALLALLVAAATAFVALAAGGLAAPAITASPSVSPTPSQTQSFSFSTPGGSSYQCALDNGAFTACASAKTYSGLAQGSHTFQVRALDNKGKTGDTATYRWVVDSVAPVLVGITRAAASPTLASSVSWTATFSEPVTGVAAPRFGLNASGLGGTPAISAVTGTGFNYTVTATTGTGSGSLRLGLTNGASQIKDLAGNALGTSLPADGEIYMIDRTAPPAPAFTAKPTDPQSAADSSSSFTFTDSESGVAFRCVLDGGTESACTSPKSYDTSKLGQGHHVFTVVALDALGNRSVASTYGWDVIHPIKDFQVTGTASRALVPGRPVALNLTIKNPNNYTVTLTSVDPHVVTVTAPRATVSRPCTVADFTTGSFNGSLVVPPGTSTLQGNGLPQSQWPTVMLRDTASNQDGCKGASLTLDYQAIAIK